MYGKLEHGSLIGVPATYHGEDGTICNFRTLSPEEWERRGFKPVEEGAPPDSLNRWRPVYEDQGDHISVADWTLIPAQVDVEAMTALFVSAAQGEEITDETIYREAALFPMWNKDFLGPRGSIRQDEGKLYRSLHDITNSAQNLKPSTGPTMWAEIPNPADEWPEWIPYGGVVLYQTGSKVSHNGKHWISTIDNNVWVPGEYGWNEVA